MKSAMAQRNGGASHWALQRRVEGLVNKHMADMALETLQQRLCTVSGDVIGHLSEEGAGRPDALLLRRAEGAASTSASATASGTRADAECTLEAESRSDPYGGTCAEKLASAASCSETAAQRKIIALLMEIKEEQQRQWAVLKELQAQIQGPVCDDEAEAPDIDLPLRSMEQLDETERHLEDAVAQKRMVSHLSRMGGATIDDAVRRLMQAVLSFGVGSELNWVGRALKRTPVGKDATHHQFADVGGSGRRQHYKPPVEFLCSE
ncbi:hypothetical protein Z043_114604 [Scleropages formosus]|uniref:DUF4806 domain-containing protein n=1 Tax=Scleropages formosus TaxID=113540 RepID=A0A0N8JYL3_SCLFO|nr:hypothetical protein Z043_114604 [Scleropages formosus]